MIKRGVAALVTDGCASGRRGVWRPQACPVWCSGVRGASVRGRPDLVGWNEPIGCGGVAVFPEDVIVADGGRARWSSRPRWSRRSQRRSRPGALELWIMKEVERGVSAGLILQRRDPRPLRELSSTGLSSPQPEDLAPGSAGPIRYTPLKSSGSTGPALPPDAQRGHPSWPHGDTAYVRHQPAPGFWIAAPPALGRLRRGRSSCPDRAPPRGRDRLLDALMGTPEKRLKARPLLQEVRRPRAIGRQRLW
jgi:hypothetical protein